MMLYMWQGGLINVIHTIINANAECLFRDGGIMYFRELKAAAKYDSRSSS